MVEFSSSETLSKKYKKYFGGEREGGAKVSIYMCCIVIDKISKNDFSKIYKCEL